MTTITIVIAGTPDWMNRLHAQLDDLYTIVPINKRNQYMSTLVDSRTAMILVDGHDAEWRFWTTTPKASPATRRIPIVLISEDEAQRAVSPIQGADLAMSAGELLSTAPTLIEEFARIPDPEEMKQLDCECSQPLPPLAVTGVQKFNAGEYYPQHDLFEEQWVKTEGPVRDLYRAILQVGVAYYQIERGNYRGALKMLQRSVQWLAILPDTCQGVDIKKLRQDSYRVRAELQRLGEDQFHRFDHALIKPLKIIPVE